MKPITERAKQGRGIAPSQEVTIDAAGKKPGNFSPCKKCGKMGCGCK
jgi:hypothetical protein